MYENLVIMNDYVSIYYSATMYGVVAVYYLVKALAYIAKCFYRIKQQRKESIIAVNNLEVYSQEIEIKTEQQTVETNCGYKIKTDRTKMKFSRSTSMLSQSSKSRD